ncbi:hypothetical protein KC19_11G069400 [Ceratodon purpureus]|uniref:F-box domain-containing protein n=1 Tax=Ceratodon purpureus TaxID=3225 RepID=A0A8T0GD42_CERPU|nr:hypothetical protein KC19_11G069400 [Ceratodon purpureus]
MALEGMPKEEMAADSCALPDDVLERVFARLPAPDISRLRFVSRKWRWNLTAKESGFKRLCADIHPKMFGFIVIGEKFKVQAFDFNLSRWWSFENNLVHDGWRTMHASDGGLVCFVHFYQQTKDERRRICVCNPLTQEWRALPLHPLETPPRMLQIVTDRQKKSYKVTIVGAGKDGCLVAELYDSSTGVWSSEKNMVDRALICANQYLSKIAKCGSIFFLYLLEMGILDFIDLFEEGWLTFELVKDRLFVLCKGSPEGATTSEPGFFVSEYCCERRDPFLIKVRDYSCNGLGFLSICESDNLEMFACSGYLMVVQRRTQRRTPDILRLRVCDRSTGEWPALPDYNIEFRKWRLFCELHWDAVP